MTKYLIIALMFIISCSGNNSEKNTIETREDSNLKKRESIHQQEWEKYGKQNTTGKSDKKSFKIKVEDIIEITSESLGEFKNPKFTSDGKNIVFTNSNFSELWLFNLEKNNLTKLVSFPKCGYKFQISEDGKDIYFRTRETKRKKAGGDYSIYKIKIENNKLEKIYSSRNYLSAPVLIDKYLYLLKENKPICIDISKKKETKIFPQPYFFVRNNKLMRKYNSVQTIYGEEKFIDCDYSKDKKYIFVLTSYNGIIIFDLEGKIINQFKEAVSITKLANSSLVLFTQEQDQGQRIISSKLFMGFLNTSKISKVSFEKSELVFNPDWSSTDNKIVYTNNNGMVKVLSFNIE